MSRLRLLIVVLALFVVVTPAYGATINIDGTCSLGEAIANANNDNGNNTDCEAGSGADTIVIPSGHGTITRSSDLQINSTITINGNGNTIDGNYRTRIFQVGSAGVLTINNLTLRNASCSGFGCAIDVTTGGNLTVNNGRFFSNSSSSFGGAIMVQGTAVINNSYFNGNFTGTGGAGAALAVYNGNVTVRNSTFTNNLSAADAIVLDLDGGSAVLEHITVVNNSSTSNGSGVTGMDIYNRANVTLRNSLFSGNNLANGTSVDCIGTIATASDNLINDPDSTCRSAASITSNPNLRSLSNRVFRLNSNSPAVNAATCLSHISTDQRGEARATSGDDCDIGAWEGQPPDTAAAPALTGGLRQISVTVSPPIATSASATMNIASARTMRIGATRFPPAAAPVLLSPA